MSLLALPDELITQVAFELAFRDLLNLQNLCHRLRRIVRSHAALDYAIELHVAGMVDNPASSLIPADRLRILRAKEKGWRRLDLTDRKVLPLEHNPSGIYDLTGGVLLLGERTYPENNTGTDKVHTVRMNSAFRHPKIPNTSTLWQTIDLDKQVIDVGLAIPEHDLIAIVTYSYINDAQLWASIDIHLLKHSTGQPHPAAAKPVLHIDNLHYLPGHCSIMLEVSGDTLCFLLNNYFPFVTADPVTLVVYNWKTGVPKVGQKRLYSDPTMFSSFILLSPETIVLPIALTNCLEICDFSKELKMTPPASSVNNEGPPVPPYVPLLDTTCFLELPPLHPGALVLRMTCRCEPNPRGPPSSATHVNSTPVFTSDPDTAVMILQMHIRLAPNATRLYTMIVHRSSLRAILDKAKRRIRENNPTIDPDAPPPPLNLAYLDSLEELESDVRLYQGGFADLTQDGDQSVTLPWEEWGPAVTRWFLDGVASTRWITTTCGQRLVRVLGGSLHICDFNQLALRRFMHERKMAGAPVGTRPGESVCRKRSFLPHQPSVGEEEGADSDDEPIVVDWLPSLNVPRWVDAQNDAEGTSVGEDASPTHLTKVVLGSTVMTKSSVWLKDMESSLPYVETNVRLDEFYQSALIDEDVIVGLKMDMTGRHIKEVALHRIGGPMS